MGASIDWFDKGQTTLIVRYKDRWIWEDFHAMTVAICEMMATVPHQVDVIVDFLDSAGFPSGSMMNQVRKNAQMTAEVPNFGNTALVTRNTFLRMFTNAYLRIFKPAHPGEQVFFTGSIDAAVRALAGIRPSADVTTDG